MTADLDTGKLRAVAEAATPGKWDLVDGAVLDQDDHEVCIAFADDDVTHIATFDPPTVLRLLARLEAAEAGWLKARRVSSVHSCDIPGCVSCANPDYDDEPEGDPDA